MKYLLLLILLSGCDSIKPTPISDKDKLTNYKCTPENITQVDKLFKICNESTYTSVHCYLHAVVSSCSYMVKE